MRKDYQEYTTAELMQQAIAWQVERRGEQERMVCLETLEERPDADEQFAAILRETLARTQSVQDWAEDEQLSVLDLAGIAESLPVLSISPSLLAQAMYAGLPDSRDLNERLDAFVRMCEEIPFADEYKKYTLSVYEAKQIVLRRLCAGALHQLEQRCSALEAKTVEQESQLSDMRDSVDGAEQMREQIDQLERQLKEKEEEIEILTEMIAEQDANRAKDAKDLHEMREALEQSAKTSLQKVTFTNMKPDAPRQAPRVYTNMKPDAPRQAPRVYTNMQPSAMRPAVSMSEQTGETASATAETQTAATDTAQSIPASVPTKRRYPKPSDFRRLMEDPTTAQNRRKRRSRDFLDEADKAIDRQKRAEAKAKQGQKPLYGG